MKVAEVYRSVQGEGFLTGTDSVFVRTSGCNLRCWFCDTPYTSWSPEGDDLPVEEVLARVEQLGGGHVVITGGEPMLYAELIPLVASLRSAGCHVTIETAGTLHLPLACDLEPIGEPTGTVPILRSLWSKMGLSPSPRRFSDGLLMSISPKFASSAPDPLRWRQWHERHERTRHQPDVVRRLIAEHAYQIKFVVDQRADCQHVEQYLAEVPEIDRARVMLMPQGVDENSLAERGAWLEPYCREHGLHFCPRRQIEWFGLRRGT